MLSKQEIKWARGVICLASDSPSAVLGALRWAAKVIDSHEELRAALVGLDCQKDLMPRFSALAAGYCGKCPPCRAKGEKR